MFFCLWYSYKLKKFKFTRGVLLEKPTELFYN